MRAGRIIMAIVLVSVAIPPGSLVAQWKGEGTLGIGYTILDQTGNQSLSAETYDVYEDPGFSLRSIRLRSPHEYELTADLENVNLNNRTIAARLFRPGRVSLSGNYTKRRRIYDFDGKERTYRTRGGVDLTIIPHRLVKLFGGYSRMGREGSFLAVGGKPFSNIDDGIGGGEPQVERTDYSISSKYVGTQLRYRKSMIETRYRRSDFTDELNRNLDRKSQYVRVQAFTPVPRYEKVTLTAGLSTGWHELKERDQKRKENVGWGSAFWAVHPQWNLAYKLLFSRTDNEADGLETDNAVSDAFVTKIFPGKAEVSAGYEFRSQDDLVKRTETNGFVFRGLARPVSRILLRWQFNSAMKNDVKGTTLVGDEESVRHRCEVRYDHPGGHQLMLGYRDRVREFEDLDAKADFRTVVSQLTLHVPKWGEGSGSYSYAKGDYENPTSSVHFEQHLIWAQAATVRYRHVQVTSRLSYLRTRISSDIEKIIFSLGANVDLTRGWEVDVRYNAHTYDDFPNLNRYYTANVVALEIGKRFQF